MIIGIDCGINGAYTLYNSESMVAESFDIPTLSIEVAGKTRAGNKKKRREIDLIGLRLHLKSLVSRGVEAIIIEKVHAMPSEGSSAGFNFGKAYGEILATAYSLNKIIIMTSPQAWKSHYNLIGLDKDASRLLAIEIFGEDQYKRKKDHNKAESALIAAYGKSVMSNYQE